MGFVCCESSKGYYMFSLRQSLRIDRQPQTDSTQVLDRLDTLIDDLLNDGNLSSSSLASILVAARESVREGYHVALRGEPGTRATTSSSGNRRESKIWSARVEPVDLPAGVCAPALDHGASRGFRELIAAVVAGRSGSPRS